MRRKRFLGAAATAAALVAILAGPAEAADEFTVYAIGGSGGLSLYCPDDMRPVHWQTTNADGSPLAPNQRVEWTVTGGGHGIGTWIAPYLNSPPPPADIRLTVTCGED